MGSRLAASIAGYRPKKSPTSAVMPMPSVTDHGSMVVGIGVKAEIVSAMPEPNSVPMMPPKTDSTIDGEHLRHDVGPAGAERLPQADLPRPLGHHHQHDVHDDDAADHERQRDDADEHR